MAIGWITRTMDMYGCQMKKVSGPTIIMAIGFIPITDGPGYRIMTGAGGRSTMAAGCMMMIMGGCGCPVMNGRQPGFPGEVEADVMGGRLSAQDTILT